MLGLNKSARFARRTKHTRTTQHNRTTNFRSQTSRRRKYGGTRRLSVLAVFLSRRRVCQLLFRSCSITSSLTLPISTPSSQQLKSSKRSSFLSSCPIVQTISSSILSEIKYWYYPLLYTIFSPLFSMYFIRYASSFPKSSIVAISTKSDLPNLSLKYVFCTVVCLRCVLKL